ncbi:ferredoxin [uncultured Jannaschia sp.]|uniref:ferredoxin n=1 Tax=uncultured Jannaschia sp. TaxID=293347 RepID=UPI00260E2321|nr:ferredoxin [uncultured Jannaschia sp.]
MAEAATWDALAAEATVLGLELLGGMQKGEGTLLLYGPDPARFWRVLQASPEAHAPDPIDRWSARVLTALARDLGGTALFPFGTPRQPFMTWATGTGACHVSPVGLLVHRTQGLNVSFRGAIRVPRRIVLPAPGPSPCVGCPAPCTTACPVLALTSDGYDLPACHAWLDDPRNDCMARGCAVRRACPASPPRPDAQAAHHMAAFHPC